MQPGEIITDRQSETLATVYREKKSPKKLCVTDINKEQSRYKRWRGALQGGEASQIAKKKAVTVLDYNKYMGGISQSDRMLYFYLDERKTIRYWKIVIFNLLSRMLLNVHVLYKENSAEKIINSRYKFNISVIEVLSKEQLDNKNDTEAAAKAGV